MCTNRTFTMIKPDAVEANNIGAILEKINTAGFRIVALKMTQMSKRDAKAFYAIHKERPFFDELVNFMQNLWEKTLFTVLIVTKMPLLKALSIFLVENNFKNNSIFCVILSEVEVFQKKNY